MPLEKLHALIESLKERIEVHRSALSGSEALTRYALIDPLLRELGWDTANPNLVVPEYKSGSGRADYALVGNDGNPEMMIEAKSLGSSLRDTALTQGIQYCLEKGTRHFALTDGDCWELYETHRAVPINEKRVVSFRVSAQSESEVCLQALALWWPSLQEGKAVAGQSPLVEQKLESTPVLVPMPEEKAHRAPDGQNWLPLPHLSPSKGDPRPVEICFPDATSMRIKYWNSLVLEVVKWLVENKHLQAGHCPLRWHSGSNWYLVNTSPIHANGNDFSRSEPIGEVWVEKDFVSADLAKNACRIVELVGQDPTKFKVRFD